MNTYKTNRLKQNLKAAFLVAALATTVGVLLKKGILPPTDVNGATSALQDAGLTPLDVGGYAWGQCGKGDTYATEFVAKNVNGRVVSGAVCSGYLKGSTIRYSR